MLDKVDRLLARRIAEADDENGLRPPALAVEVLARVQHVAGVVIHPGPRRAHGPTGRAGRDHDVARDPLAASGRRVPNTVATFEARHRGVELGRDPVVTRVVLEVLHDLIARGIARPVRRHRKPRQRRGRLGRVQMQPVVVMTPRGAHLVGGLKHDERLTLLLEAGRSRQPGRRSSDDERAGLVYVCCVSHAVRLTRRMPPVAASAGSRGALMPDAGKPVREVGYVVHDYQPRRGLPPATRNQARTAPMGCLRHEPA